MDVPKTWDSEARNQGYLRSICEIDLRSSNLDKNKFSCVTDFVSSALEHIFTRHGHIIFNNTKNSVGSIAYTIHDVSGKIGRVKLLLKAANGFRIM